MRRARILEEYNKELVTFAGAQERNWASAAPQLFRPNFLKEAADYLQHLQLIHKVKQPRQNFRPPSHSQGGGRITIMETTTTILLSKDLPFGELESSVCMNSVGYRHQLCCEPYVGHRKGYGVHSITSDRDVFKGGREINPLCQHLEVVNKGQLDITDCQGLLNSPCRAA